jgi:hypothetical protein
VRTLNVLHFIAASEPLSNGQLPPVLYALPDPQQQDGVPPADLSTPALE